MRSFFLTNIRTAYVFRSQVPQEDAEGNVRALAIRNLAGVRPLQWQDLPRIKIDDQLKGYCLQPGDVVIPSRGDRYRAWCFEGADEPVFPLGQLNVITPSCDLDPHYLAWYLNRASTQAKIALMLSGTSILALTKSSLQSLVIEAPEMSKQRLIADLESTTQRIALIRHRLNELDAEETAHLTDALWSRGREND
jgi:hypothetical protein